MKFCHGDKHCNLQQSPQIRLPPSLASVIALTDALSLFFDLALSKTFICWIHTIPAPIFPPVTGSIFSLCGSRSICTFVPSEGWTSLSASVFSPHVSFHPGCLHVSKPLSAFPSDPVPRCFPPAAFSVGSWFQYFMLNLFSFLSFAYAHMTLCSLTSPLGYTFSGVKLLLHESVCAAQL